MKKIISLLLSFAMLLSITAGIDLSAYADEYTMSLNGKWLSGNLSESNTTKWYKFEVPSDGIIKLYIMHYMGVLFSVYNEDLSTCISNAGYSSGTTQSPVTDSGEYILSAGIYYAKVNIWVDWAGNYGSGGNFKLKGTFQSYGTNEKEPNNFDNPMKIDFGKTITGAFTYQDKVDWFKLVVPCKSIVTVKINSYTGLIFEMYNYDLTNTIASEGLSGGNFNSPKNNTFQYNLNAGTYYIKMNIWKNWQGVEGEPGKYDINLSLKINVSKPSTLKVSTRKTTSLKLSWSKVSGVSGYQLQQYKSNKWSTVRNTTENTYTVSKLKAGTKYNFRVRAYKKVNGKYYYSGWTTLTTPTKPATVTISSAKSSKSKSITVKWKSVTCSGYQVQYSTSSKFTSKTTKTAAVKGTAKSKTLSKLKGKKKYYVRVRAYKTVNGQKYYGAWSKAKAVTTKK